MATKVTIEPGICNLSCAVSAELIGDDEVAVDVTTGCESIKGMFEELGDTFDTFEVCLQKPGLGPFYEYAREHFPVHVSCPALCGIIKAIEVEAKLALPKDASIHFE